MKWHLQILRTTWVLWGYGPRALYGKSMHCGRASIDFGDGFIEEFKLPEHREGSALRPAQEHERLVGYGWRWNTEDGTAGHPWSFAETREECLTAAQDSWELQRITTQAIFAPALKDVRMVDEIAGACDKCGKPNDRAAEGNYCTPCRSAYSKRLASLGSEYRPVGTKVPS